MSETPPEPAAEAPPSTDRRRLAPLWHTAVLVGLFLALAVQGMLSQGAAPDWPEGTERAGSALPLYLTVIAAEWCLLGFVVFGLRKRGTRLRDLIGERWRGWRDVARDVAIGLLVWGLWSAAEGVVNQWLRIDPLEDLRPFLPRDPLEIAVWVALSLTAGFCEEAIFRGYLQRQLFALTGNIPVAVVAQAVIFGLAHGYQGVANAVMITVFGALFGVLAAWRRSLKPGMILHAWTDITGGIFGGRT